MKRIETSIFQLVLYNIFLQPIDRTVGYMLNMDDYIDVIIPRGGKSLIERVLTDSKVHVIRHLDGIYHTYIHKKSDPNLCKEVTFLMQKCEDLVSAGLLKPFLYTIKF